MLFFNVNRNGYAPDQCERTMTVGELICLLEQFDEDAKIYTRHDNGYTYGSIRVFDIIDSEEEGESA